MLNGILILAAFAGAMQQQPAPMHYRITLKATRGVDRTANGDEAVSGTYMAVAFVTATTTTEAGGRVGHVVIDSVRCSGTGIMSMAYDTIVGTRSRGARYDFPIGSHLESVPLPTIGNTLTNTLAQTAVMLFPNIDPGARTGTTWVDSLDTSPMSDATPKPRPVVTRWRVVSAPGDSLLIEGDVRAAVPTNDRMTSTGLTTGVRHLTVVGGALRMQTSSTSSHTIMAPPGATVITSGSATTTLEIVLMR